MYIYFKDNQKWKIQLRVDIDYVSNWDILLRMNQMQINQDQQNFDVCHHSKITYKLDNYVEIENYIKIKGIILQDIYILSLISLISFNY